MARPQRKLKEVKQAELAHEVEARSELVVTLSRKSEPRLIAYGEEFIISDLRSDEFDVVTLHEL